jgi:hypothetical protein
MEASLTTAADALKETIARLELIAPSVSVDTPVTLNAVTPYHQTVETSFGREVRTSMLIEDMAIRSLKRCIPQLWFCGLHAVHHWAMVRFPSGKACFCVDFLPRSV